MNKCSTCGANSDGEYCFRHKPRKPLAVNKTFNKKIKEKNDEEVDEMRQFFLKIWRRKLHYSEVSMDYLGKEPLSVFFHHILPKEKYPEAMYDEENIIILTLEEHDNVEKDMYKYPEVNRRRELLKIKYNLT